MSKREEEKQREQLDEFEAYGEYTYAYRHASDDPNAKRKKHESSTQPITPETPPEESYSHELEAEEVYLSPEEAVRAAEDRAKARSRAITGRLILLFVMAVVGLVILQSTVFRLNTVYVVGNVQKTAQQVAAASGLVKGLNIFAISEEEVQRNLRSDHTIILLGLRKDYPSTIYLYIAEREPIASTQWLGLVYTLDDEGIVMEERNTLDLPSNMPRVTGLQVTNVHVGQRLEVRNREQMLAYQAIISELQLQFYMDQIVEMNLSNPNDIYLLTTSGISVRLGGYAHMRAKIGALRTDMAYLLQLGKTSGTLDITIPEDAKYRPES